MLADDVGERHAARESDPAIGDAGADLHLELERVEVDERDERHRHPQHETQQLPDGAQRGVPVAALGAHADGHRRGDRDGEPDHAGSAARRRSAATSGGSTLRCTPVPSSSPATCASRGSTSMCQQKRSASRGAVRTQRFSGGRPAERRLQSPQRRVQQSRAEWPVVGEAGLGLARHDLEVERHPRRERAERDGLVVDGHDPLAVAHLLLQDVLEQVATLGAVRVGGEALAFARHGRGHERQRVQLRVRVRQRGARVAPLVDDQVRVGGARVGALPLAPDADGCLDLLDVELRQRPDRVGRVDDHLVPARRRLAGEQVRLAAARAERVAGSLALAGQRRVAVRHHAHGPAVAGGQSLQLGRRLLLVAGRERVVRRIDRRARGRLDERSRAVLAVAGHDRAQSCELVDAQLRHRAASPSRRARCPLP